MSCQAGNTETNDVNEVIVAMLSLKDVVLNGECLPSIYPFLRYTLLFSDRSPAVKLLEASEEEIKY
jgi:hypothetical protein